MGYSEAIRGAGNASFHSLDNVSQDPVGNGMAGSRDITQGVLQPVNATERSLRCYCGPLIWVAEG